MLKMQFWICSVSTLTTGHCLIINLNGKVKSIPDHSTFQSLIHVGTSDMAKFRKTMNTAEELKQEI